MIRLRDKDGKVYLNDEEKATIPMIPDDVHISSERDQKKTEYGPRTREVEKATLTAAVMSTSGGMGKEMDVLVRQIATKLSVKRGERA